MRFLAGLVLAVALLLLHTGCARFNLFRRAEARRAQTDGPRIGMPAPEIAGVDFAGEPLRLSDYQGKVVVVTFWYSQCPPCKAMIPHERQLAERHAGKPFALLSVNNDENPEDARKIMSALGVTWPNWKTTGCNDAIAKRWGVTGWPAVFVIDAAGILRYANLRGPHLDNAVETLLTEMKRQGTLTK